MSRIASNSLRRRIERLKLMRVKATDGRSIPSKTLLDLIKRLEGMSKEHIIEIKAQLPGSISKALAGACCQSQFNVLACAFHYGLNAGAA